MKNRLRPQVLAAILFLGVTGILALFLDAIEVATGCVGGIIALGGQVLEKE